MSAELQSSIETDGLRLARLKREKEDKLAKIAEIKNRLNLIERRKVDYFPQLEKSLLNQYLEYKGNIRVFVRVRPILSQDFKAYSGSAEQFDSLQKALQTINSSQISIDTAHDKVSQIGAIAPCAQTFNFDCVFDKDSTQGQVYDEVQHLI